MLDVGISKLAQIILYGHEIERAEHELRGFVEALNDAECHSLIAVMWIGRESFGADEYPEALATARQEAVTPTADYLIGTPHFSDHLDAGLEVLGLTAVDAEEELLQARFQSCLSTAVGSKQPCGDAALPAFQPLFECRRLNSRQNWLAGAANSHFPPSMGSHPASLF